MIGYKKQAERGNILFIILIAVALFATLSYTVTQTGGHSGSQLTRANAGPIADDLILFASSVEKSVVRMVQRGVSENDLCFDYDDSITTGYEHAGCATLDNRVFAPEGGGVVWKLPQTAALDPSLSSNPFYGEWFVSAARVLELGTTCSDQSCSELILFLPYVDISVCEQINRRLDIPFESGNLPLDGGFAMRYEANGQYAGAITGLTFNGGTIIATDNDPALNILSGRKGACFESDAEPTPSGSFHFYYVILPR